MVDGLGILPSSISHFQESESKADRKVVRHPAEIDLGSAETLGRRQIALRFLPADLAPDADRSDRKAHAAENDRPGNAAAACERVPEDRTVGREELPALAVSPRKHADATADVGLDAEAVIPSHRQKAHGR